MTFKLARIKSGIIGLDEMIEGGIPFPSTMLVAGGAGNGKTTFGLQFLSQGAIDGERGVYFATLSEPIQWLLRFTQDFTFIKKEHFGNDIIYMDLGGLLKKTKDYNKFMEVIEDTITEYMPQRIVIDPVTVLTKRDGYREFLFDLTSILRNWETTAVLTGEVGMEEAFPVDVAYVVDSVILLTSDLKPEGARQKYLEVLKMRGTLHSTGAQLANITDRGLQVQAGMGGKGTKKI